MIRTDQIQYPPKEMSHEIFSCSIEFKVLYLVVDIAMCTVFNCKESNMTLVDSFCGNLTCHCRTLKYLMKFGVENLEWDVSFVVIIAPCAFCNAMASSSNKDQARRKGGGDPPAFELGEHGGGKSALFKCNDLLSNC